MDPMYRTYWGLEVLRDGMEMLDVGKSAVKIVHAVAVSLEVTRQAVYDLPRVSQLFR
jgi:hypothetical protein